MIYRLVGHSVRSKIPLLAYTSRVPSPSDQSAFEDQCTLVLPYHFRSNGHCRISDGAISEENPHDDDDHVRVLDTLADIHEPGNSPFAVTHAAVPLSVLTKWITMILQGEGLVNEGGVMDGIDEWKKADTEENWEKYVLPVHS
jgi:hypothetical protein